MDFDKIVSRFISSVLMTISSFFRLIFWPYKTMRTLRVRGNYVDLTPIFFLAAGYFVINSFSRGYVPSFIGAVAALVEYLASMFFFSILPSKDPFGKRFDAYIKTWTYTLFPTLLWFYSSLVLYYLLPPPRTSSFLGKSFSVIFLAYSISLIVWKFILVYLSVRFSSRIQLPRVIYYALLYLIVFAPFWIMLYKFGISRIPFV